MNRVEILTKAHDYITADRNKTHGEPEDNFQNIAAYWTTYLRAAGILMPDTLLHPEDVAALNILQKVARMAESPQHPDHWIDIAGYAACGGECATKTPSI